MTEPGKAPVTGPRLGFNWSIGVDRNGIPIASALAGANRHDSIMFEPTLESVADRGLLFDVEALHLDRGYNSRVRRLCDSPAITRCHLRQEATTRPSEPHQATNTPRYVLDRGTYQLMASQSSHGCRCRAGRRVRSSQWASGATPSTEGSSDEGGRTHAGILPACSDSSLMRVIAYW